MSTSFIFFVIVFRTPLTEASNFCWSDEDVVVTCAWCFIKLPRIFSDKELPARRKKLSVSSRALRTWSRKIRSRSFSVKINVHNDVSAKKLADWISEREEMLFAMRKMRTAFCSSRLSIGVLLCFFWEILAIFRRCVDIKSPMWLLL